MKNPMLLIVLTALLGACGNNSAAEGSQEAPAAEPAAEPAAPPPANALGVGIAEITEEHLRAALSLEGWEMNSVSSSGGNMNAIARYNGTRVHVGIGRPIHPSRRAELEGENVPMQVDGENALYVEIEEDPELAQRVLDALMAQ